MKLSIILMTLTLTLTSFDPLRAAESGWVKITKMGCRATDTICFVYFDQDISPPAGCPKRRNLNWDTESPGGKNHLSLLETAFAAGKQVKFGIPHTCLASDPNHPTFDYYYVQ